MSPRRPEMIRPPWERFSNFKGILLCTCAASLADQRSIREHWQAGHLDRLAHAPGPDELAAADNLARLVTTAWVAVHIIFAWGPIEGELSARRRRELSLARALDGALRPFKGR